MGRLTAAWGRSAIPGCSTNAMWIAVAVAAARVALGVHWTTDVIAGLFVGCTWFALCAIAFGGRVLRFGEPVEVLEVEADRTVATGSS